MGYELYACAEVGQNYDCTTGANHKTVNMKKWKKRRVSQIASFVSLFCSGVIHWKIVHVVLRS